ncbi:MAG: hypothetical protein ACTHJ3_13635 [Pararhizobium sp.]
MSARERVRKYRKTGGASDLVRVEVLVPASKRDRILTDAATMRAEHRSRKKRVQDLCSKAAELYGARVFDNIDLARLPDPMKQARVVASALMERGDARAFAMARTILAELER